VPTIAGSGGGLIMEIEEARKKIQKYCAYQDRCHSEVRTKLLSMEIYGEELEELLVELITDGFLNEERFAHAFARGKFRMKGWGRIKIRQELSRKHIHDRMINTALKTEIDEEEYWKSALRQAQKKADLLYREAKPYIKWEKVKQHLYRRGFEWEIIQSLKPEVNM